MDLRLGPAAEAGAPGHDLARCGVGTVLSAWFILAANSWMQHPVGYELDDERGRPSSTDSWAVLFNNAALFTFPHTLLAAFITAGVFMVGVAAWHLLPRRRGAERRSGRSLRLALPVVTGCGFGVAITVTSRAC